MANLLALSLPPVIADHLEWWVAGIIVVVGLLGIGLKDVLRFNPVRVWAVSSVCFAESIRRKVLWITPLAILGVLIVGQFTKPLDPLDDIRQTTKFALFASALVLTVCLVILACTNLPKEIDNRVIYTVVTKPTTRLEIILGKIVGFARVSLAILLIMGIFTGVYLWSRASYLRSEVRATLAERQAAGPSDTVISDDTLRYYAEHGLLFAKSLERPASLSFYARLPELDDTLHWFRGEQEQEVLVPFDITPDLLQVPGAPENQPAPFGILIGAKVGFEQRDLTQEEIDRLPPEPTTQPMEMGPALPTTKPRSQRPKPRITISLLGADRYLMLDPRQVNNGSPLDLPTADASQPVFAAVTPQSSPRIAERNRIYVQIIGPTPGTTYCVPTEDTAMLLVIGPDGRPVRTIMPSGPPILRGRPGSYGGQLRGGPSESSPVAIYRFRNTPPGTVVDGKVPFELRLGIERGTVDVGETEEPTVLALRVRNVKTGQYSDTVEVRPENNRTAYFDLPAAALEGGDFDVLINCTTNEHWIGLQDPTTGERPSSLMLVAGQEPFAWNLIKGLLVMWLMSVLVIVVSIFCSTFLSWPIAIVLTLVILLGRWGVEQLGEDATGPGIGRQVVTDLGLTDAAPSKVVSETVDALARGLKLLSTVLPDISAFNSTDLLERGLVVPWQTILASLSVLASFALPITVLSYVFLRNKEVAP